MIESGMAKQMYDSINLMALDEPASQARTSAILSQLACKTDNKEEGIEPSGKEHVQLIIRFRIHDMP